MVESTVPIIHAISLNNREKKMRIHLKNLMHANMNLMNGSKELTIIFKKLK
jgi:hypothetical protein